MSFLFNNIPKYKIYGFGRYFDKYTQNNTDNYKLNIVDSYFGYLYICPEDNINSLIAIKKTDIKYIGTVNISSESETKTYYLVSTDSCDYYLTEFVCGLAIGDFLKKWYLFIIQ